MRLRVVALGAMRRGSTTPKREMPGVPATMAKPASGERNRSPERKTGAYAAMPE